MLREKPPWSPQPLPEPPTKKELAEASLEAICPLPTRMTDLQQERFDHRDLAGMSSFRLLQEKKRVELRIALDPNPDPWFFVQLDVINQEETGYGRVVRY